MITSVYGPPSWLKVSVFSAFLFGLCVGLIGSDSLQEQLVAGTGVGLLFAILIGGAGWKVRRDQGITYKQTRTAPKRDYNEKDNQTEPK